VPDAYVTQTFQGFQVDHISISSYSDHNGWGSILAHGTVGNLLVSAEHRPVSFLTSNPCTNGVWQAQFASHTNWVYSLERTTDFSKWTPVSPNFPGTEGELLLQDTNPPTAGAFYRVHAQSP
jgi:hypothetical protein